MADGNDLPHLNLSRRGFLPKLASAAMGLGLLFIGRPALLSAQGCKHCCGPGATEANMSNCNCNDEIGAPCKCCRSNSTGEHNCCYTLS